MTFKFLKSIMIGFYLSTSVAHATLITFDSIDNGWYLEGGSHSTGNTNTYTGCRPSDGCRNSFYNFDFGNALQNLTINSATVTFFQNGTYNSSDSFETVQLWDVTTTPGSGSSILVYNDLMTGVMYGSKNVSSMAEFTVNLNTISFADILNDNFFSIGAHLSTADSSRTQAIWSGSNGVPAARLNIDYTTNVPEPSTLAIFALGIIGLASRRFKKQS